MSLMVLERLCVYVMYYAVSVREVAAAAAFIIVSLFYFLQCFGAGLWLTQRASILPVNSFVTAIFFAVYYCTLA